MLFSQRKNLKPATKAIQLDDMDDDLRNGLWSIFHSIVLQSFQPRIGANEEIKGSNLYNLFANYWVHFLKRPVDTLSWNINSAIGVLRNWYFEADWNEVYDFLEFSARYVADSAPLVAAWNVILENESSGYRFVGRQIIDVIDPSEMASIENATDSSITSVRMHMTSALKYLSDRKSPDYRNSVKESISAVEALCRLIVTKDNATLGEAIAILEKAADMHPAFMKALTQLYGYTSDESGIRHALLDAPSVSNADARFMLVVCSAFVNYATAYADKAGIDLTR